MRKFVFGLFLAGSAVVLAGCDTTSPVVPYAASTQNVIAWQSALKPSNNAVAVGAFSSDGIEQPGCRMVGTLDVTAGKSFGEYIKNALQTELFTAQVYNASSNVVISGSVDEVKVNTFGTGSWTLGLQVKSTVDPAGYRVEVTRNFQTSYVATSACANATNAFSLTVQDLLAAVIANPGFGKLTGKS